MKLLLPKLIKWFIKQFFVSFIAAGLFSFFCFYVFFRDSHLLNFIFIFFLGFFFSNIACMFLFFRFLHPLSRVFYKVQDISEERRPLNTDMELYWDEEPGEFYEINKNLNQIHNHLKRQKRIISQESSELEAVISALTEAILAVDQDQKVLFFNNQATLLFSGQRKSSHKSEILLSEMIRNPDILQAYNECLQKDQVIRKTLSIGFFSTEEENSIYEITVAPFKKTYKSVYHGAVGLFYDISDIKKTEQIQLDFITNVSHELRTPLTAIQGYVETLLEEKLDKNQSEQFLSIINRNVKRLVSLLNHFLDLSHMEGAIKLKKENLSTEEITRSIIRDLHIKNHEIHMNFSQKTVKADRHFLKQVLYNLLDNAVKYVPPGRLIEILWTKEKNDVVLRVKDHGEGISSRHRSRLFEKFYRVDPARKEIKGAGIGLSIVKKLVEKHGGTIKVQSERREGSVFICAFPD